MSEKQSGATGTAKAGIATEAAKSGGSQLDTGAQFTGKKAGIIARCESNGEGVSASSATGIGVVGRSDGNVAGVSGSSATGIGVVGRSDGGLAGVSGSSAAGIGVVGHCDSNAAGISGTSVGGSGGEFTGMSAGVVGTCGGPGAGVGGRSAGGYGGEFFGGTAPLRLTPSRTPTPGHPTTGEHRKGELYVDSTGGLFFCKADGTPGTWKQLA